ncbi:MAG: hypothetical protein RMI34_08355 [Chloroherpetonaceae bacterium]|nr:hypothetical protein [Chloroherpetonaceae bacterium]MCS7212077.1 hypothetical protein [Chloroherpetonaceae bacterium]MDW8020070.1 hypothetical protein [Chloroherpetonaceae bacterium]MDW8465840.1 hypothetical protein [Chloroherpetonaceae bacterium]
MADEPKKLSPMMAKKLAQQKAAEATPAETTAAPTAAEKPVEADAPAAKPMTVPIAKTAPAKADTAPKNPDGTRYGYSDGMPSVFGTPPAIDDAYFVVKTLASIPAAILDGAIGFFKKVTS